MHARDKLNEMKWHRHDLDRAVLFYLHRGAPNDEGALQGSRIAVLGRSFIEFPGDDGQTGYLPYHRLRRIEVDGKVVWRRPGA